MRYDKMSYTDVVVGFNRWLDNIYQPFVYDNDTKEIKASDILYALDKDTYNELFDVYCKEQHIAVLKCGDGEFSLSNADVEYYKMVREEGD